MPNTGRRVPKLDLVLYHWSPRDRRESIQKHGFRVRSESVDRMWRPPLICFSDDPLLAWYLSGKIHPEIEEWDLWMVLGDDLEGWECIFDTYTDTGRHYVKEYRVYHNVKKSNIRWIGSRTQKEQIR